MPPALEVLTKGPPGKSHQLPSYAWTPYKHFPNPRPQRVIILLYFMDPKTLNFFPLVCVCVCVCVCTRARASAYTHAQSCPTLCDIMNCSLLGSSSMGFPRQECWSGLPFPTSGDLPHPGIEPAFPALAGGFFTTEPPENRFLPFPYL